MATDKQVEDALIRAAEALLGRTLQPSEQADLINRFRQATGTARERSIKALSGLTNLTESQIRVKAAASNDTDRKMDDLRGKLDDWKPGT